MGNSCCTSETKDETSSFTFTQGERKQLLNNMNMMHEKTEISEHAPKSGVAHVADSMNDIKGVVKQVYDKEGIPPVSKKDYSAKFEKFPYLGPYKFQDGSTFEGQFKLGLRHGFGRQVWVDGSVYEGYWMEDKCNGKGRLINSEGHVYFGDWIDDKAHGKGYFKHIDGTSYEGDWENDAQSGYGKETWNDGSVYQGQYKDSLKHGIGSFVWADKSKYEGEFMKNDISGSGKCLVDVQGLKFRYLSVA